MLENGMYRVRSCFNPEAIVGAVAPVRRAVVHDPEDPAGRAVGLTAHDLIDDLKRALKAAEKAA